MSIFCSQMSPVSAYTMKCSAGDRQNAAQLQVTVQKILPRQQCSNHPKLRENMYDSNLHICAYLSLTRQGRSDACEVSRQSQFQGDQRRLGCHANSGDCYMLRIFLQPDEFQGDSGGALTIVRGSGDHKYRQFAVGIVSYGFSCALRNTPGIYTRISTYQSFILKHVKEMGGSQYLY